MPRPSLCLNISKTGSSFTSRFFDAADWLELRRRCGLGRLAAPNRASVELVKRIKRYGPGWGNLTCRLWNHHAGYSSLPSDLRRHPKLCALRDLRGWYCSFYLYHTTAMTDNLLSRAIRLLVGGDATAVRDGGAGEILSRHRRAFLERFRKEDAGAGSMGNLSMEFVVWFTGTVRLEVTMNRWVGMDGMPAARTGLLTFRAITILFDDPGKCSACGRTNAMRISRAGLTCRTCGAIFSRFRPAHRPVVPGHGRRARVHAGDRRVPEAQLRFRNASREDGKRRAMRELDAGDWFERTIEDEAVHETYLLARACRSRGNGAVTEGRRAGPDAVDLAGHIGSGSFVGTHPAHDDHVQGGVGLAVPAAIEAVTFGFPAREAGIGQTPRIVAKLASERRRSGFSPTATIIAPAFSVPTPSRSSRLGASSWTSGTMKRSSSAISSLRSMTLRARDFR